MELLGSALLMQKRGTEKRPSRSPRADSSQSLEGRHTSESVVATDANLHNSPPHNQPVAKK